MRPIVQISLDVVTIEEAVGTAAMALRAGVDWLEAGTPLIIAEGMHGVRALRERFPDTPIVADLKTMDGGWLEAELMAQAGATHVVVMARAHDETIRAVVKAGCDLGLGVMGDNMAWPDMVDGARRLEDLGCGYVDSSHRVRRAPRHRRARRADAESARRVAKSRRRRVGASPGGRRPDHRTSRRDAQLRRPARGLGSAAHDRRRCVPNGDGDVEASLRLICERVHGYGNVRIRGRQRRRTCHVRYYSLPMPRLAVFPKAWLDDLSVTGAMSLDTWIDMASTLPVEGLELYSGMLDLQDRAAWPRWRHAIEARGLVMPMMCCIARLHTSRSGLPRG